MTYTDSNDVVIEISAAIESQTGRSVEHFDLDAIIGEAYTFDEHRGFVPAVTVERFWDVVTANEHDDEPEPSWFPPLNHPYDVKRSMQ